MSYEGVKPGWPRVDFGGVGVERLRSLKVSAAAAALGSRLGASKAEVNHFAGRWTLHYHLGKTVDVG